MSISTYDYDIFVIGCGPAGLHACLQAARFGKRIGVAEPVRFRRDQYIDMGSITSKTIREVVLHGFSSHSHPLDTQTLKLNINLSMDDFINGIQIVSRTEQAANLRQLQTNGIDVLQGTATYRDYHKLIIKSVDGVQHQITADKIVIASGSGVYREPSLPIDGVAVFTHEDILAIGELPARLAVLGGGIIGLEYACIFQRMGVDVTLIDHRDRLLPGIDMEIVDTLFYSLRKNGMKIMLGTDFQNVDVRKHPTPEVYMRLTSGDELIVDKLMVNRGRRGKTGNLNLPAAGISPDEYGFIPVNKHYQTSVPHIYAVGDVTGYPHLASVAMEQGRRAALHAVDPGAVQSMGDLPMGIYTIPEIASVGKSEDELKQSGWSYVAGYARYRDMAKGLMVGDDVGLLKILFEPTHKTILGVHIIGEGASEIIHTGKAVMALGGSLEYFTQSVFNYPSLTECYRIAALDGLSKLRSISFN